MNWDVPLSLLIGYLLGSIPFGLILTRSAGLGDIRSIGSGNIGATNVLRTGNKGLAAATLLLDGLQGHGRGAHRLALAVSHGALAAALGAFLGHCFPVWLEFKGGKGVATYPRRAPRAALADDGDRRRSSGSAIAAAKRYSSLAALVASACAPLVLIAFGRYEIAALTLVLTALIWLRHRANIGRLIAGEESRIGAK